MRSSKQHVLLKNANFLSKLDEIAKNPPRDCAKSGNPTTFAVHHPTDSRRARCRAIIHLFIGQNFLEITGSKSQYQADFGCFTSD